MKDIIDDISFETLPAKWQGLDFTRCSKDKVLFDFQKQGLQKALKALWLLYKGKDGKKALFYNHQKANGFEENFY